MVVIEGVVAVQNHGSSGSTLLQSLLDSHPRLLGLPGLNGRNLHLFWEEHGHLPAVELLPRFLGAHAHWIDPSLGEDDLGLQQMGQNRDEATRIDGLLFGRALKELGWDAHAPLARRDYITSIYIAY